MSAHWCCTAWKAPSGRPNWTRSAHVVDGQLEGHLGVGDELDGGEHGAHVEQPGDGIRAADPAGRRPVVGHRRLREAPDVLRRATGDGGGGGVDHEQAALSVLDPPRRGDGCRPDRSRRTASPRTPAPSVTAAVSARGDGGGQRDRPAGHALSQGAERPRRPRPGRRQQAMVSRKGTTAPDSAPPRPARARCRAVADRRRRRRTAATASRPPPACARARRRPRRRRACRAPAPTTAHEPVGRRPRSASGPGSRSVRVQHQPSPTGQAEAALGDDRPLDLVGPAGEPLAARRSRAGARASRRPEPARSSRPPGIPAGPRRSRTVCTRRQPSSVAQTFPIDPSLVGMPPPAMTSPEHTRRARIMCRSIFSSASFARATGSVSTSGVRVRRYSIDHSKVCTRSM